MTGPATVIIRNARDDERVTVRNLTLLAYEEYATTIPELLWQGYRRQLLATLDAEGGARHPKFRRISASDQ